MLHVISDLAPELGPYFIGLSLVVCIAAALAIRWKGHTGRDQNRIWSALIAACAGAIIWAMTMVAMTTLVVAGLPTHDLDRLNISLLAAAVATCAVLAAYMVAIAQRTNAPIRQTSYFETALQSLPAAVSVFDREQRLVMCNPTFRELYRLSEEATRPGTAYCDLLPERVRHEKKEERQLRLNGSQIWQAEDGAKSTDGEAFTETLHLPDGRVIRRKVGPISGGGWIEVQEDITASRRSDERTKWLARHDVLTEIANRHQFRERVEEELASYDPRVGFALHWIDLDCFKEVNDTYGHPVGDAFLKSVANRLATSLRAGDLVGRLGGDEFAILQKGGGRQDLAQEFASRVLSSIARPHDALGHRLQANASIGIALAPEHGTSVDQLFANADAALYQAKSAGRGVARVYQESAASTSKTNPLRAELERAFVNDELVLRYQPIVDLRTGQVTSFEALMRWKHPSRGMLPPSEFIGLAEETGLIIPMGAWALKRACMDCQTWPDKISVAVNLSTVQIEDDLYETVKEAVATSDLDPRRLQLEITVSALLRDRTQTPSVLRRLSALGVTFTLDALATRFATFDYLRHFPFSKLKVHCSFVNDLPDDRNCTTIVKSVAELAHELGMRLVVGGVETAANLATVRAAACDAAQGFYFSPPVPARAVVRTLSRCILRLGSGGAQIDPKRSDLVA